jgi:hypothetical protein
MRNFELNVFIDCPRRAVYDHIANPINMIGLQPHLTTIDVLKERKDGNGVTLRPFYTLQTFRWAGLPIYRNRLDWTIHLTRPGEEFEFHVRGRPNIYVVFKYILIQDNEKRTRIKQTVDFVQVSKVLEKVVADQANHTQRAVLSNLKVRLEKNCLH